MFAQTHQENTRITRRDAVRIRFTSDTQMSNMQSRIQTLRCETGPFFKSTPCTLNGLYIKDEHKLFSI